MRVTKAFSLTEFDKIARRDVRDFSDFGTVVSEGNLDGDTYIYKDNGADVLGVAHLDTVQNSKRSSILTVANEKVLVCPVLDDRLGVYIITKMLPRLGIKCDWLLTTGEEVGRSSAELFTTDKKYKWCFSFDRAGTDTVLYQFDSDELRDALKPFGFNFGHGTFSDLSFIDIGCSGANFGCGYHDAHGIHAYAILSQTFLQVGRFRALWRAYSDKALPYDREAALDKSYGATWHRNVATNAYSYPYTDYPYTGYGEGEVWTKDVETDLDWKQQRTDWPAGWSPRFFGDTPEREEADSKSVSDWAKSKGYKVNDNYKWYKDKVDQSNDEILEALADQAIDNE